jgi:hypothetical protein
VTGGTDRDSASAPNRKIFISYRRENTAGYAHLLYDRLNARFPNCIFMDVSSIRPGEDFVDIIERAVSCCDVLVALIDRQWISIMDRDGNRRVDNPHDFVRLEIAVALNRKICVIPALLNGASMPGADELPEDLLSLTRRQALHMTDTDLDYSIVQLIEAIHRELSQRAPSLGVKEDQAETVAIPEPLPSAPAQAMERVRLPFWRKALTVLTQPTRKNQVILAVLVIGVCILAQFLGSTQKVTHFFVHTLGFSLTRIVAIVVLLLTVTAYAFGFTSVYRARPGMHKYWLVPTFLAFFIASVFANLIMRPWPEPDRMLGNELPAWIERVFENQNPSGGVRVVIRSPDARDQVFTTAQCLKGVLLNRELSTKYAVQIRAAFDFVDASRHTKPQEGWGYWAGSPRTLTEVSAWVTLAYIESLRTDIWNEQQKQDRLAAIDRELNLLAARRDDSGGWGPILERNAAYTRTYSTVMPLWAFIEAAKIPILRERFGNRFREHIRKGIQWLLATCDTTIGWMPNANRKGQHEQFPGLTAQVLFVLSRAQPEYPWLNSEYVLKQTKSAFLAQPRLVNLRIDSESTLPDTDQHFHTEDEFTAEGMHFLWFPWALAVYKSLSEDPSLAEGDRKTAADNLRQLLSKSDEVSHRLEAGPTYVLAENLIGASYALDVSAHPGR